MAYCTLYTSILYFVSLYLSVHRKINNRTGSHGHTRTANHSLTCV